MLTWFLILLIRQSVSLEAGIYGNAGIDYKSGNNALALYDPKTGNVTTIAKSPTDVHSITESDLATFDSNNELYIYYTEVINYTNSNTLSSVFAGYNLLNPATDTFVIQLPFCKPEQFVGAGFSFDYNGYDGNIYVWCPDSIHNNTQNLARLQWNKNKNTFNSTIVNTYNTGSNGAGYPLFSVIDNKRNYLWVSDPAGAEYMFYIDLKTGNISKKMFISDWKFIAAIYSDSRDEIISSTTTINEQKLIIGMNITFGDPQTGAVIDNKTVIVNINSYNYIQEFYPPVYTMDDINGIWYQLMWKYVSYGVYNIDLISINIDNGELINEPEEICTFGQHTETCPKSIIYITSK